MRWAARALLVLAVLTAGAPARAERLVSSLSSYRVLITSSFTGTELILFGTVEADQGSAPRRGGYDLVVTVSGPRENLVVRRKERVFGIWVNVESRTFVGVPSYLATLSTKPVEEITNIETLRRLQIGLRRTLLPQQIGPDTADVVRDDPFRIAFLRLKQARNLYYEIPNAVTFRTPILYRASIPVPAEIPVGNYDVDLKLFADGNLITRGSDAFEIVKFGFEQVVASAAVGHGLLYGLCTAMIALMTGWFASVVFRRD